MTHPENEPTFLILKGVGPEDKDHISAYLADIGLRSLFVSARDVPGLSEVNKLLPDLTQQEIISQNGYRFEDIRSPADIMFREHFEDLAQLHGNENNNYIRAFHWLIDGDGVGPLTKYLSTKPGAGWEPKRAPMPPRGVTLVSRSEAGFEPYQQRIIAEASPLRMAEYGIRAGSLVRAVAKNTEKSYPKIETALEQISSQVSKQLCRTR